MNKVCMFARCGGGCNIGGYGREGQCSRWLTAGLEGYHTQSRVHAFAAMGHTIFLKRPSHPVLQSATTLMREWDAAKDDVGKACRNWEVGQIQRAGGSRLHLIAFGQMCKDGFVGNLGIGDGGASGEEVARCTGV